MVMEIDFKKPFDLLVKLPAEARGDLSTVARSAKEEAPSEAANSIWWTHGESNPDLAHAMGIYYRYIMGPSSLSI